MKTRTRSALEVGLMFAGLIGLLVEPDGARGEETAAPAGGATYVVLDGTGDRDGFGPAVKRLAKHRKAVVVAFDPDDLLARRSEGESLESLLEPPEGKPLRI